MFHLTISCSDFEGRTEDITANFSHSAECLCYVQNFLSRPFGHLNELKIIFSAID